MNKINLSLTIEQAEAVSKALDFYARITVGQIEELTQLVRVGAIPLRITGSNELSDDIGNLVTAIKNMLGYHKNSSNGIGNRANSIDTHRAYEVLKVLDKAIVNEKQFEFSGVRGDGLTVRYTRDEAPIAFSHLLIGVHQYSPDDILLAIGSTIPEVKGQILQVKPDTNPLHISVFQLSNEAIDTGKNNYYYEV